MSITSICFCNLASARSRILARNAETILCHDEDIDNVVMLFDSGETGDVLTIELDFGDATFESLNLANACKFVKAAKGRCDFTMAHDGFDFESEERKWPEKSGIDDDARGFKLVDDDEPSDWWKRGAE